MFKNHTSLTRDFSKVNNGSGKLFSILFKRLSVANFHSSRKVLWFDVCTPGSRACIFGEASQKW